MVVFLKNIFFTLLLFLLSINTFAEVRILNSRTEAGSPWRSLTGQKTLYRASLDTNAHVLILEEYDDNKLVFDKRYPLNSTEELKIAQIEMRKLGLDWPLETQYQLFSKDCSTTLFTIPTGPFEKLAGETREIISRIQGNREDYGIKKLMHFSPACGHAPFYLGAVLSTDDNLQRFALVSEDSKPLSLTIVKENSIILIKSNELTLVRISEQDSFDQANGGRFSASVLNNCQDNSYKEFSLEIRPITKDGKRSWTLSSMHQLRGRIRLVRDQQPGAVDVGETIAGAPVELVKGVIDGVFGTLFWNLFVPKEKKINLVEKKIFDEAKKNESMTDVFTDKELKKMAHDIATSATIPAFSPIWGTANIKKRAALTFSMALVRKTALKRLPPGSLKDMAQGVAIHVTRDLEHCLREASGTKDIDVCVAKFARSAPYRVGRELLDINMSQAIQGQGLNSGQKNAIMARSLTRFDQCSKANYFGPYDDHIKSLVNGKNKKIDRRKTFSTAVRKGLINDGMPFDANAVITACLYQGSIEGANEAVKAGSSGRLNSVEDLVIANQEMKQCLSKKGYLNFAENFIEYNQQLLMTLSADNFTKELKNCLSLSKINIGELVIKEEVKNNKVLRLATIDQPEKVESVAKAAIEQGYRPCLKIQGDNADPAVCAASVENVASREAFLLILKNSLAEEMGGMESPAFNFALREIGLGTIEPRLYSFDLNKCFNDRRQKLLSLVKDGQPLLSDDFSNANCATRAILELAPELVRHKYINTLRSKPDLKNVNSLQDENFIREMGLKMRACLSKELTGIDSMVALGGLLDSAQKSCTIELYHQILPIVVEKALEAKLLKVAPKSERRAPLVRSLTEYFKNSIKNLDNEDEIISKLDDFSIYATVDVAKKAIFWAVEDNLPAEEEEQKELAQNIIDNVIIGKWDKQITKAMKDKDEELQHKLQSKLKRDVGPLVLEKALLIRLKPHIKNTASRSIITKGVVKQYKRCLDQIKENSTNFDKGVTNCGVSAANNATHAVFEFSLRSELERRFPIKESIAVQIEANKTAQKQINSLVLTTSLWSEISKANAQGPKALEKLANQFKIKAAREIAHIILERELHKSLKNPELEIVLPQAREYATNCFKNIEGDKNPDNEINACARKIKSEVGRMSLMESFKNKLGILKSNLSRGQKVLNDTSKYYLNCMDGHESWSEKEIDLKFSNCVPQTILNFAQELGSETTNYLAPVRSGSADSYPSYEECLNKIKEHQSKDLAVIQSEIDKCATGILKPKLLVELHNSFNKNIRKDMSWAEQSVAEDAFTILTPVFDAKIISSSTVADPVETLKGTFAQLAKFISAAAHFDQVTTQRRITAFKAHIRALLASKKTLTDKEFTEELVKSDLMSTIIESVIVDKIASIGGNNWANEQASKRLITPQSVQYFFEKVSAGKRFMEDIKTQIVRPLLAKKPMTRIIFNVIDEAPKIIDREMNELKRILMSLP